jgi:hypothetical protein
MNKIHPPSQGYGATRKPARLIFGEQFRERLDQMPSTKSGKRKEETISFGFRISAFGFLRHTPTPAPNTTGIAYSAGAAAGKFSGTKKTG